MPFLSLLSSATGRARVRDAASRRPLLLVALGVVIYSFGPVFAQASQVSGPVFAFWRLWLGAPALGVLALVHIRSSGRRPTRRAWRWPLYGGLAFGTHQLLFFTAIKATSVVDVALMNTLGPIVVGFAAVHLFGERARPTFWLWTVVAISGAAIVALGASTGPDGDPLGMVLALCNVVAFMGFFLVSKRGRAEIDVLPFLFGVIAIAAVAVTAFGLVAGEPIAAVSRRDVGLAAAIALGPGLFGHFVMTWPLQWVAANVPPVMRLGQPILSGLLAWALLAEPITGTHLVGGAATITGVAGAVLSRPRVEI